MVRFFLIHRVSIINTIPFNTVGIDSRSFLQCIRVSVLRNKPFIGENPHRRERKPSVQLISSDTSKRRQLELRVLRS